MQRALRRCSSSLGRTITPRSSCYRYPRLLPSLSNISSLRTLSPTSAPAFSIRCFQTSTRLAQDGINATSDNAGSVQQDGGPATTFQQLGERGLIHPNLLRSLTQDMGLHTMTDIQTLTIHKGLKGVDM